MSAAIPGWAPPPRTNRRLSPIVILAALVLPIVLLAAPFSPTPERVACDPLGGPFMNARFFSPGDVSLSTGAFEMESVDLHSDSLAGRFSRAYLSLDTRVTLLGPGWTSNMHVRIRSDGSRDVFWTMPNGAVERFKNAWDVATAVGTSRGYRTLTRRDDGSWIVEDDGDTWTFDYDGNLVRFDDRLGDWVELRYEAGKIASTVGPNGPGLRFEIGPGDRLARVASAEDPRFAVEYEYDTLGRLVHVARRGILPTRFIYDGDTQRITSISNETGLPILSIEYDDKGWVLRERDFLGLIDGEARTFAYDRGPGWNVRAKVVFPPSLEEPGWHPIKIATMDGESRLTELQVQPTSKRIFVGRYAYDDGNRRVPLERPCSEVVPSPEQEARG